MPVVVWGTKVRERGVGNTAIYCPQCDGVRVADVFAVEQAQHIYYLPGEYHTMGTYVRCRLCGGCAGLPPHAQIGPDVDRSKVAPDEAFLKEYHPALLHAENLERPQVELPKGITREQLGLFLSLNKMAETVRSGRKVDQNAGGLVVIALMIWGIGGVACWSAFDRNLPMQIAGIGAVSLVAVLLVGLAWLWTRYLGVRGIHEALGPYVERFIAFMNTTVHDLANISARSEICGWWARRYLRWLSAR